VTKDRVIAELARLAFEPVPNLLRDGEALEAPDCPAFVLPEGTTGVNVH
jgi:hypothetical protein